MAFWRATASTQPWRLSLRLTLAMRLQAQKHGTVSHWHFSIQRAGGKKILHVLTVDPWRQLILLLLIPCSLELRGKYVFFLFLEWEITNTHTQKKKTLIHLQGVDLILDSCQWLDKYLASCWDFWRWECTFQSVFLLPPPTGVLKHSHSQWCFDLNTHDLLPKLRNSFLLFPLVKSNFFIYFIYRMHA